MRVGVLGIGKTPHKIQHQKSLRDLAVAAPSVHLTEKAMVGRNFRYWSEDAPSIDEGAVVRGSTTQRPLPDGWTFEGARRGLFVARTGETSPSRL